MHFVGSPPPNLMPFRGPGRKHFLPKAFWVRQMKSCSTCEGNWEAESEGELACFPHPHPQVSLQSAVFYGQEAGVIWPGLPSLLTMKAEKKVREGREPGEP